MRKTVYVVDEKRYVLFNRFFSSFFRCPFIWMRPRNLPTFKTFDSREEAVEWAEKNVKKGREYRVRHFEKEVEIEAENKIASEINGKIAGEEGGM